MDKKALRREISAKKRAMTPEQIESASQRLAAKFFSTEAYKNAKSIYAYLSYNQEVRTEGIIRRALADGKRVSVPKVFGDDMKFLWIHDLEHIAPGAYNIPEPIADGPEADDDTALILMPGLAFDPQGHRLGYGGGFYDRYLAVHHNHTLVALCYDFQMFDHLETEAHDIPVNLVIADFHDCGRAMNLVHRPIDFNSDRHYVLECHCRINYECECPWKRRISYEDYRAEWFSMSRQIAEFYDYLQQTATDTRTIAEIIETSGGAVVGYLWAPFSADDESGFCFSDIQDIYIEESFRRMGVADELLEYAEQQARLNGAKVIRSGTGCENTRSIKLHVKRGYYQYRFEYEKLL